MQMRKDESTPTREGDEYGELGYGRTKEHTNLKEGEKSTCEYDNAIREDESMHSANVGKGQEHTLEERKGVCV